MPYEPIKAEMMRELAMSDEHRYTKSGIIVPGVTSAISDLMPFGNMPNSIRDAAFQRGTLVHKLTEMADIGEYFGTALEDNAVEAGLNGYIDAWWAFRSDYEVDILQSEQRVMNVRHWYAGTFDRIVKIKIDGVFRIAVLDIKTGAPVPAYALQTAAYLAAYLEGQLDTSNIPDARCVVQLKENGQYHFEEHKDKTDFGVFAAQLTINNWRLKHGGGR